jgi:hypothetical protein
MFRDVSRSFGAANLPCAPAPASGGTELAAQVCKATGANEMVAPGVKQLYEARGAARGPPPNRAPIESRSPSAAARWWIASSSWSPESGGVVSPFPRHPGGAERCGAHPGEACVGLSEKQLMRMTLEQASQGVSRAGGEGLAQPLRASFCFGWGFFVSSAC